MQHVDNKTKLSGIMFSRDKFEFMYSYTVQVSTDFSNYTTKNDNKT